MKLLDCTLRDGGYYNNWDFSPELVEETVSALHLSGVDIIEIGYKSLPVDGYAGLCRVCNEEYLEFLGKYPDVEYAFMVDVKEFIQAGSVDTAGLNTIILPAAESVFDMCRMATHFESISALPEMVAYFQEKGYQTAVNLMGISLLNAEQVGKVIEVVAEAGPDVFYFADSFGSMGPQDVSEIINSLRRDYEGAIGVHTHDNQGLAFSNSITALDSGASFIDSTITGMGRGAGNLHTEQMLLWMQAKLSDGGRYRPNKLLDIIADFYAPMKDEHGWGYNYVYMLSGLNNIHQSYCMAISDGNKFAMPQISRILEQIHPGKRAKFDNAELVAAINTVMHGTGGRARIPDFDFSSVEPNADGCLVVAPGPGLSPYKPALDNLLSRIELQLLECNHTGIVDEYTDRYVLVHNRMRLAELQELDWFPDVTVITGEQEPGVARGDNVAHVDYEIGPLSIESETMSIPDFEAGQYAIAIALKMGFKNIFLAGFIGYEDESLNRAMNSFFCAVSERYPEVSITALTPSKYTNLEHRSLYCM